VDARDIGDYAVEIVETGERSAPAHLHFEVSPKIAVKKLHVDDDEVLTVTAGSDLYFEVELTGYPTVSFPMPMITKVYNLFL
jgi:hypothetical protein